MQLLPSLLFGISASLDALLVGISYGLRGVRIRAWQNLVISSVALLGTCLSACAGRQLLPLLPAPLADSAGSIILILLGTYYAGKPLLPLLSSLFLKRRTKRDGTRKEELPPELRTVELSRAEPSEAAAELSPVKAPGAAAELPTAEPSEAAAKLPACEALILSLTLSLNNIGIGLSASMAGLHLLPAAVMTFGCSALFLLSGNQLGRSPFLRMIGSAADPISGLLLVGLGLIQLVL